MNGSRSIGDATWRRFAATLLVGSVISVAFIACSGGTTDSTLGPQESPANKTRTVEAEPAPAALSQHRDCDRSTSIYTVDAERAVAMGEGSSRQAAITNTIENAIKDDVAKQFECSICPDEVFPEVACDDYFGTIAKGGAELEDPDEDCELIDGRWYCFSWVIFDSTSGSQSWAQAGCDLCDEEPVSQTPSQRF